MAIYDVAAGLHQDTLNNLVGQLYNTARASAFKGSVASPEITAYGISKLDWDIAAPPVVTLSPSPTILEQHRELLLLASAQGNEQSPEALAEALATAQLAAAASFDVQLPSIVITVNYAATGTAPTVVRMSAVAAIELSEQNDVITPKLVSLQVSVPADPDLAQIINSAFVPALKGKLQSQFLSGIRIPQLALYGVQLGYPKIMTSSGFALAMVSMQPAVPGLEVNSAWPRQEAFAAVDIPLVNALINGYCASSPISGEDNASKKVDFYIGSITFHAHFKYSVTISNVSLALHPDDQSKVTGSASVGGTFSVQGSGTHLPTVSVSGKVTAKASANGTVSVDDSGVYVKLDGLDNLDFHVDLHNVAAWLDDFITDSLKGMVEKEISSSLASMAPQKLCGMPVIPLSVGSSSFTITLGRPSIATSTESDGTVCLLAAAQPLVR